MGHILEKKRNSFLCLVGSVRFDTILFIFTLIGDGVVFFMRTKFLGMRKFFVVEKIGICFLCLVQLDFRGEISGAKYREIKFTNFSSVV